MRGNYDLPKKLKDRLKKEAAEEETSQTAIVRAAVEKYFADKDKKGEQ
jgi:predicted DNA-binding protein